MHKYIVIILLTMLGGASLEACCFWKCKNKVASEPRELIKIHQRDLSVDGKEPFNYVKVEEAVNKISLAMVREIHLNQKASIRFGNVSPEGKALYLGLVAKRYNENLPAMEKLEEKITEGNERYRRIIVAPKAHDFRSKRKKQHLPSHIAEDIISANVTPEVSHLAMPGINPHASSTEQSPK